MSKNSHPSVGKMAGKAALKSVPMGVTQQAFRDAAAVLATLEGTPHGLDETQMRRASHFIFCSTQRENDSPTETGRNLV
jgi:hypothetical protein